MVRSFSRCALLSPGHLKIKRPRGHDTAMADDIILRPATASDRAWIVDRHQSHYSSVEGFDATFGPLVDDILGGFFASHDAACERGWIAERDGARLGCIFCVRHDSRRAKLRLFYVDASGRGAGLGRRLLGECMRFAREAGYSGMTLWTHESHRAACALYASAGWRLMRSEPVHSFGVDLVEQSWEIDL
jgi:GNAT superfamily N-acetyltransferase